MIAPIAQLTTRMPATQSMGQARQGRFLNLLRQAGRQMDAQHATTPQQGASQLLSQLFIAPLLAETRKLPFGQQFAHGGRTEDVFGEQLDQRVADAVAASDPGGITKALARQLQSGVAGRRQGVRV